MSLKKVIFMSIPVRWILKGCLNNSTSKEELVQLQKHSSTLFTVVFMQILEKGTKAEKKGPQAMAVFSHL